MSKQNDDSESQKAVAAYIFLDALYHDKECPICTNRTWFLLNSDRSIAVMASVQGKEFTTYVMACTRCGYMRQHVTQAIQHFLAQKAVGSE